ncbi:MAG: hypothetical protein EXS36_03905 [Pedosphaera sp.]|nr:hypothetical protein [Pedosphaera sp.]
MDGKWNSHVTVLNLATGLPPGRFDDTSWGWEFSPDETLLAAGMEDHSITLRNLEARTNVTRLKAHTGGIRSLKFSPDGRHMAAASEDNTIRLWDTTSWKELDLLRGQMGGVIAAMFSPDGRFLASGSADQALKLWDVSSIPARELLNFPIAPYFPSSVMLPPDSSVLVVNVINGVTEQRTVLLLRAPSFAEIDAREKAKKQERATVSGNN